MIYEVKSSKCCCLESELLQLWQQDFVLAGLEQDISFISAVANLFAAGTSSEYMNGFPFPQPMHLLSHPMLLALSRCYRE